MSGFEIIEHTADIGIRAWGRDMEEAFEEAALGMFSIIADVKKAEEVGEAVIMVENDDWEGLLVDWLSELLYAFDADRLFLKRFEVHIDVKERLTLTGHAYGELYNPEKHGMGMEIKAVTYHMVEADPEKAEIKVLFDI